jgi:hypothetical protein
VSERCGYAGFDEGVKEMSVQEIELRRSVRAAMEACPNEVARAALVSELVRECYSWVKANIAGGGLDGADSAERTSLGEVLDSANLAHGNALATRYANELVAAADQLPPLRSV